MPKLAIPTAEPEAKAKSLTILGSTGSIGQSTLKVISQAQGQFRIIALTAQDNVDLLITQAREHKPEWAVIGNEAHFATLTKELSGTGIKIAAGAKAIDEAATLPSDLVMAAIVGAAGLSPVLAAIRRGATVALANKECLVCAGQLMLKEIRKANATLIPVDSEHNAIFQVFDFERPETVEKVIVTASGGPFRDMSLEQMKTVTPQQATRHPNWNMGAKISVDSATMMNKGLELIEAHHLFPLKHEQLEVIIHPESIVHSMVAYVDGSVLAQMGSPDMCTPISYALAYPERIKTNTARLDLSKLSQLTFRAPDTERFPALRIARAAMEDGGAAPIVMNAANEIAVAQFLQGNIAFLDIVRVIEQVMDKAENAAPDTLEDVLHIDNEARISATEIISNR